MVHDTEPTERYHLRIKEGKLVTVRKYRKALKLCAVDVQKGHENAYGVKIQRRVQNQINQMAFLCQLGSDYYLPKVDGKQLKLDPSSVTLCESHWFERVNQGAGSYYALQSVVKPVRYLSYSGKQFCISDDKSKSVLFTDEIIPIPSTNSDSPST